MHACEYQTAGSVFGISPMIPQNCLPVHTEYTYIFIYILLLYIYYTYYVYIYTLHILYRQTRVHGAHVCTLRLIFWG